MKFLLDNPYIIDILHQPDALLNTLNGFNDFDDHPIRQMAHRLVSGELKQVVLTGMGSSFHALHPLHLKLLGSGIQAHMLETSELVHYAPKLLSRETLVVAVSQSGRSAEVVQLLDLLHGQVPCVAVTNTKNSPLAEKSSTALITQAGEEFSVSCKTYISALAALLLLGDLLVDADPAANLAACRRTAASMGNYLLNWESHVEAVKVKLAGIHSLMLTGRGASLAAVGTGGLIIKEAAHFHAEGMSSAAFRHGPFEMVSPTVCALVYAGNEPTRQLNENLVADICKAGGRVEMIACNENSDCFNLPAVSPDQLPILEILPAQMVSIGLAVLHDHAPGIFERGNKVTIIA